METHFEVCYSFSENIEREHKSDMRKMNTAKKDSFTYTFCSKHFEPWMKRKILLITELVDWAFMTDIIYIYSFTCANNDTCKLKQANTSMMTANAKPTVVNYTFYNLFR